MASDSQQQSPQDAQNGAPFLDGSPDGVVRAEVRRRRTFAIISHPDAGKTTLTEKLLLYCGAIHEAGEVSAKANRRKTVSDWMALERERGISVSSSVLQFEYRNLKVNLLDTPGHQDFSEDTYRTLMAADSAVMVIDAAKGVEPQTLKLFDVCRMRGIPIFTFINKMDREARDPFELLQEIENVLKIGWYPVTWPIGTGPSFRGVYHLLNKEFYFFEPADKAGQIAKQKSLKCEPNDKELLKYIDADQQAKLIEELELVQGALPPFDVEKFSQGQLTPALFASARNNFGLGSFLDLFADVAPPPQRKNAVPQPVDPLKEARFTGFIFKIPANMDKAHRDRIAFMRICSGKFERDMNVKHSRLGKVIRLSHAKQFLAQDRTTINEAFGGDIVGLHDAGNFMIGDTVYTGPEVKFEGIPQFSPERFAKVRLKDPLKRKQFQKGVQQLSEEGMIQMFVQPHVGLQDPILGVVGVLQFDVMMYRLKDEYGVDAVLERMSYSHARWIVSRDPKINIKELDMRVTLVQDLAGNWVALFNSEWELNYTMKNAPAAIEWYTSSAAALAQNLVTTQS